MRTEVFPDWAKKMTDSEWETAKKESRGSLTECATCGKRLILTICKSNEKTHYCISHCPKYKWQTDYDWPKECARCGILYTNYLEALLRKHSIKF